MSLYFPELEPWVAQSASLPAGLSMRECGNVGPRGATHCSACPALLHSESGPLGLSVHECGAAGSASGQTACALRPTLRQSWSRHSHASPLHPPVPVSAPPTGLDECLFFISLVSPPCRSILCQFWLCKEVQCVYLHRHLGSLSYNNKLKTKTPRTGRKSNCMEV